jgi:hypothetical protein
MEAYYKKSQKLSNSYILNPFRNLHILEYLQYFRYIPCIDECKSLLYLYNEYTIWSKSKLYFIESNTKFKQELIEQGFKYINRSGYLFFLKINHESIHNNPSLYTKESIIILIQKQLYNIINYIKLNKDILDNLDYNIKLFEEIIININIIIKNKYI